MTLYNVHIYREVHLTYESVEADKAHAAVAIALDKSVGAADDIDDCAGETFSAYAEVAGDDTYEHSVTIDFEAERLRKVAPEMLQQLRLLTDHLETPPHALSENLRKLRVTEARAVIAKATSARRPA